MKKLEFHTLTQDACRLLVPQLLAVSADVSPWRESELLTSLPGKWDLSFTADCGFVAGYCVLSKKFVGRVHIHQFMVHPSLRGRSIGTEMLREAGKRSVGERLSLKVHMDNTRAIEFYLRNAFRFERDEGPYRWMVCANSSELGS